MHILASVRMSALSVLVGVCVALAVSGGTASAEDGDAPVVDPVVCVEDGDCGPITLSEDSIQIFCARVPQRCNLTVTDGGIEVVSDPIPCVENGACRSISLMGDSILILLDADPVPCIQSPCRGIRLGDDGITIAADPTGCDADCRTAEVTGDGVTVAGSACEDACTSMEASHDATADLIDEVLDEAQSADVHQTLQEIIAHMR